MTRRRPARRATTPVQRIGLVMTLLGVSFVLARIGRDALYFQGDGIRSLPLAYAGGALLALPVAAVLLTLARRVGPRRARLIASLAIASLLAIVGLVGQPGPGVWMTVFFMSVPVLFGALFSLVWLLAGELAMQRGHGDVAVADAFSRAGAASLFGGLVGAGLARGLSPWLSPRDLLLVSAATLVVAAAGVRRAQGQCPPAGAARPRVAPVTRRGFGQALSQPYVRLLLGVASAAAIVGVLIEFLFYQAASSSLGHGNRARLFADVYLALNLTALVVQRFVVPRLQTAIGLTGVLLVLPGVLVGIMPFAMLTPSAFLQGVLRLTEGGLKSSIYRVGWEQTYLPIMGRCRAEAKLLVDGVATRMAEGLVAVLLYAWTRHAALGSATTSSDLMLPLAVMAILWIALVVRTQRHLDHAPRPLASDHEAYTVRVADS